MSPHERKILATIEKELRNDDPELAAVLDRTSSPSFSTSYFPLSIRHVLLLLGALVGLVTVYTVLAEQLGLVGLAALTGVAVVPWIVATAWSAERRSRTADEADERPRRGDGNTTGRREAPGRFEPNVASYSPRYPSW